MQQKDRNNKNVFKQKESKFQAHFAEKLYYEVVINNSCKQNPQ